MLSPKKIRAMNVYIVFVDFRNIFLFLLVDWSIQVDLHTFLKYFERKIAFFVLNLYKMLRIYLQLIFSTIHSQPFSYVANLSFPPFWPLNKQKIKKMKNLSFSLNKQKIKKALKQTKKKKIVKWSYITFRKVQINQI